MKVQSRLRNRAIGSVPFKTEMFALVISYCATVQGFMREPPFFRHFAPGGQSGRNFHTAFDEEPCTVGLGPFPTFIGQRWL